MARVVIRRSELICTDEFKELVERQRGLIIQHRRNLNTIKSFTDRYEQAEATLKSSELMLSQLLHQGGLAPEDRIRITERLNFERERATQAISELGKTCWGEMEKLVEEDKKVLDELLEIENSIRSDYATIEVGDLQNLSSIEFEDFNNEKQRNDRGISKLPEKPKSEEATNGSND